MLTLGFFRGGGLLLRDFGAAFAVLCRLDGLVYGVMGFGFVDTPGYSAC
jgi:hypothetical protein